MGGPDNSQGVLPQNWGENELNRSVICMVLKATANDRHHLALYPDEFPIAGQVSQSIHLIERIIAARSIPG
ncbi:hypothetical protein TNCV_2463681 [Trichonephila clavipes]|nr:hypothetical protein TNCV_2463681 [Trichonephila clavipes]